MAEEKENGGRNKSYGFLDRKRARESAGESSSGNDSGASASSGESESAARDSEGISEPTGTPENPSETLGDAPRETANVGGDGGNTAPRKRGRHRRDCPCERCNSRRAEAGGGETSGTRSRKETGNFEQGFSGAVNFQDLFGILSNDGKKPNISDAFGGFWKMGFMVAVLAGYGEHWKLADSEAKQLGKCTAACLDSIPGQAKIKAAKAIEKYAPWVALIGTGAIVTYPRYALTQEMIKLQRAKYASREKQNTSQGGGSNPQASGANPNPSGTETGVIPVREPLFTDIQ